jgi:hypothetical protein
MIKIIIIIILKLNSGINLEQSSGHKSGWPGWTQISMKIKVIIIIVLKLNSGVSSREGSGH